MNLALDASQVNKRFFHLDKDILFLGAQLPMSLYPDFIFQIGIYLTTSVLDNSIRLMYAMFYQKHALGCVID